MNIQRISYSALPCGPTETSILVRGCCIQPHTMLTCRSRPPSLLNSIPQSGQATIKCQCSPQIRKCSHTMLRTRELMDKVFSVINAIFVASLAVKVNVSWIFSLVLPHRLNRVKMSKAIFISAFDLPCHDCSVEMLIDLL